MIELLKTEGVGPASRLEIEFAPRMNFFTGDNGLGKTFVLELAWWALTGSWSKSPITPIEESHSGSDSTKPRCQIHYNINDGNIVHKKTYTFSFQEYSWIADSAQKRPHRSLVSARLQELETSINELNSWLEIRGLVSKDARKHRYFGLSSPCIYCHIDGAYSVGDPMKSRAFTLNPDEVWDGKASTTHSIFRSSGLIQDWASWVKENGEQLKLLELALDHLSPSEGDRLSPGPLCRLSPTDSRDHPTLSFSYDKCVPLVNASSGIRRVVSLAYMLLWTWDEHKKAAQLRGLAPSKNMVLLIDEIEAHLHPRWQRTIVGSLQSIMTKITGDADLSVQVIATTHSPLILASLDTVFDEEKDAIWEFDTVDDDVVVKKFPWRRVGDVNHWLTSSIFDLKEPYSFEAESAINQARELLKRRPLPPLADFELVDQQLRQVLGDTDPFWIRWSARMDEARGVGHP